MRGEPISGARTRAGTDPLAAGLASLDAEGHGRLMDLATEQVASSGRPVLLASTWIRPTIVVGSAQPDASILVECCRRDGLAVERRRSGGGAVYCDGRLLGVDLVVPVDRVVGGQDVTESYRTWGEAWISALAPLGVRGRLATVDEARQQDALRREVARSACWAALSPYEVLAGTPVGKLVGFSQRRRRGLILLQAGIACAGSQARVLPYLALAGDARADAESAMATAMSLERLGVELGPDDLWEAIRPVLRAVLDEGYARS